VDGTIDPLRDIEVINLELMLADLFQVQIDPSSLASHSPRWFIHLIPGTTVGGKAHFLLYSAAPSLSPIPRTSLPLTTSALATQRLMTQLHSRYSPLL
jgi:hypothetical protein